MGNARRRAQGGLQPGGANVTAPTIEWLYDRHTQQWQCHASVKDERGLRIEQVNSWSAELPPLDRRLRLEREVLVLLDRQT